MVIMMWLLLELFLFQATLVGALGIQASSSSSWFSASECSHGSSTGAHTARSPLPLPSTAFASTSTKNSMTPNQFTESSVAPTIGSPSSPATNPPSSETLQPEDSGNSGDFMNDTLQPEDSDNSSDFIPMSFCASEHLYSCQVADPDGCRCDELCPRFGDCCFDSEHVHNSENNIPNFECVSNVVLSEKSDRPNEINYFWMVASCPKDDTEVPHGLRDLCEVQSLHSPPISDNRTGLVYRNKHCAQCHGVPDREQITWRSQWLCKNSLMNTFNSSGGTMDMEDVMAACNASVFKEPPGIAGEDRHYPLRKCDGYIIYQCQPPPEANTSSEEYRILERLCRNEPGKVKTISTARGVYKNEFCALCSSPDMNNRSNLQCPPMPAIVLDSPSSSIVNSFPVLLDVTLTGIVPVYMNNITITSIVEQSCPEGQVYDVYEKECRKSHCQHNNYNGSDCLPVASNSYPSNCTLIALNDTEYQVITSQIIYWSALKQNVSVQGYNIEGKPLVCTNFTTNFTTELNKTVTRTLYDYPAAFTILTYLGLSMDTVAAAILLVTYAAFAKMRTFFGKLFMNFVLVLLLGDLTFLLGTALYAVTLEDVVCQVVAILLHYLFLARFMWMSLLSLNVARHFYHAAKFIVSEDRENWRHLMVYMAAGWLSPLVVLVVTVPLNYAISGTVGYGVDGLCWMNETLTIIMTFIVPLIICIIFTAGAFVFVCIILVKLRRSDDVTKGLKHRTGSRNCRVLAAVFCITGIMWLFGFLALIDSALSWAWYIFIILNTTQAVFLTLAYTCTAKVLRLYRAALLKSFRRCARNAHGQLHIAQQTVQLELTQPAATKDMPS